MSLQDYLALGVVACAVVFLFRKFAGMQTRKPKLLSAKSLVRKKPGQTKT